MIKAELKHINERLDQVENTRAISHNPFPKHVGGIELQLEERLMTIIGMSMMKRRTQWVAKGDIDGVGQLRLEMMV